MSDVNKEFLEQLEMLQKRMENGKDDKYYFLDGCFQSDLKEILNNVELLHEKVEDAQFI